jgi:hypothetical protein
MKRISLAASLVFMFIFILMSFAVQAQITDDTFQQAVKEYQAAPTFDNAKKVVKLSAVMRKLPSIPEEARKHFVRGRTIFEDAKSPGDFTQATEEFLQATRLAPWWPEARYNTALAFEAAKNYANAIVNLKIYQLFKLSTNEARTVQDKIYSLEAKQEKVAIAGEKKKECVANDGRFCKYADGTVLDTQTNLMWAAKDNGYDINWYNAKTYCENYRGGGYSDWRMPMQNELVGLYDSNKSKTFSLTVLTTAYCDTMNPIHVATELIDITCIWLWNSEMNGSPNFDFRDGRLTGADPVLSKLFRVLPVRSGK